MRVQRICCCLRLPRYSNQNAGLLREASGTVREQVENKIQSDRENGITEIYERARIHRTEIARYEKKNGTCMITLQSAVEYLHYSNKGGKVIKGDEKRLTQTRYNTELMYIQDAGKFGEADAVRGELPELRSTGHIPRRKAL